MLPICPFCRKNVEPGAVWCSCGVNLSRYPKLPTAPKEIKEWLLKYAPEEVSIFNIEPGQMLIKAKESLVKEQDSQVNEKTQQYLELATAEKLIAEFLQSCEREMLAPTLDIGQLRRERWRQWRHVPAQYRLHPPLKDFRVKPGYLIQVPVSKYVEDFCLAIDGSFYKHQLNAQDPFPLEELLKLVPINNLAEALNTALVELLKTKQQPAVESRGFFRRKKEQVTKEQEQPAEEPASRRSFFRRKKESASTAQEQAKPQTELNKEAVGLADDSLTATQPSSQPEPSKEAVVKVKANNNERKSKLRAVWQMLRGSKTATENQNADTKTVSQPASKAAASQSFVPLDELTSGKSGEKREETVRHESQEAGHPVSSEEHKRHSLGSQTSEQSGAKVITVKVGQVPVAQENKENQDQKSTAPNKTVVSE